MMMMMMLTGDNSRDDNAPGDVVMTIIIRMTQTVMITMTKTKKIIKTRTVYRYKISQHRTMVQRGQTPHHEAVPQSPSQELHSAHIHSLLYTEYISILEAWPVGVALAMRHRHC